MIKLFPLLLAFFSSGCVSPRLGFDRPGLLHPDGIFLGRILSTEDAIVGNEVLEPIQAALLKFQIWGDDGSTFEAYDRGTCPASDVGDGALLVFVVRMIPEVPTDKDSFLVYTCLAVDRRTAYLLSRNQDLVDERRSR